MHELNKPVRKAEVYDDLPSIDSHDEDEDSWDSNISDEDSEISGDEDGDNLSVDDYSDKSANSDEEMPYEINPRKQRREPAKPMEIQRLPIKLADGKIQRTGIKAVIPTSQEDTPSEPVESDSEEDEEKAPRWRVEDVSTGARFGRPAVVDVLKTNSRRAKVELAKDQIAGICQEIVSDPENNVCHSFNPFLFI